MNSEEISSKKIVLVLNAAWQPINDRTPEEAFKQLATDVATAFDIDGPDNIRAVKWAEWLRLPVRPGDNYIHTPQRLIRVPTAIMCVNYAKVPKRRPTFSPKAVRERDKGICQYTGRKLKPDEGNIEHVHPRSKGGKTSWENCVYADKQVNSLKANKPLHESGLKLLRQPKAPPSVPAMVTIRNSYGIPDWDLFLKHK